MRCFVPESLASIDFDKSKETGSYKSNEMGRDFQDEYGKSDGPKYKDIGRRFTRPQDMVAGSRTILHVILPLGWCSL